MVQLSNYDKVRIIQKHHGNLAELDAGYWVILKRTELGWIELAGTDLGLPWCPYDGVPGDCIGHQHDVIAYSDGTEQMMIDSYLIPSKTKISEEDGVLVIDITGHEPRKCDGHPESGCVECYPCNEVHDERLQK